MFSKAQIAKLSVENQELLAEMELSKTRRREKLLERARGLDWRSRYWPLSVFAIFIILVAFYHFGPANEKVKMDLLYFFAGMTLVNVLIFHIVRSNRRLDALLELLEMDHKLQDDVGFSKDETVG
jgi:amino acid transporter